MKRYLIKPKLRPFERRQQNIIGHHGATRFSFVSIFKIYFRTSFMKVNTRLFTKSNKNMRFSDKM